MIAKETELKKVKRLALLLLLGAAGTFIVTLFLEPGFWVNGLKAISEAAMVGALADWFAVVALFKRVPIPFIARHTAIIPRNKNKIADNLALFVREKFLDTSSITGLIRRHDPAKMIGVWLTEPHNTDRMGSYILQMMRGFLGVTDDQRIQAFIKKALHAAIDQLDLSVSVGNILDSLTKNGRHQDLLDAAVSQLIAVLNKPTTRLIISSQIIKWLKREHPIKEKMLPTEWLGEHSAELVANAVNSILDDISQDRGHELRQRFDQITQKLIDSLKHSPDMARRAQEIKEYLKNDDVLNRYIRELWDDLRAWILADMDSEQSVLHANIAASGAWLGQTLSRDAGLRASLNQHMEAAAAKMAPDFSAFLTQHISDTVKSWDERDMSRQIELNIGKDLQFIRINGTLVGGCIGVVLYLLSQLPLLIALAGR
ncbi:uncharacterized membrane-anchored protein YjiN (DUF445 family) [Biostraticola tofi]|uniref:Uncharacterized membrane-anchored protein YjiN (DUF445 family) n=1 Tax=Biostraticola tofi TaxID=466109 RepID=A0A4R3YVV7_9GAMM|nr:uncharacterized membrane-anchored protein YjiN (DUF445 family) [Biostraticola tofi]